MSVSKRTQYYYILKEKVMGKIILTIFLVSNEVISSKNL